MSNPFPGMNPYLENPHWWRSVHARLISTIDEALNQVLPSQFVSTIEERVYLGLPSAELYPDVFILGHPTAETVTLRGSGGTLVADAPFTLSFPDEQIHESYIEIRVAGAEEQVVAVIEVLSPTNKTREAYGRDSYVKKQDQLLHSDTHLVEIDLLREGVYTVAVPHEGVVQKAGKDWQYIVSLYRVGAERSFDFWPVALRSRLPRIAIPLTADFDPVVLDVQACLNRVYEAGAFARRIDYRKEAIPPLTGEQARWADQLLRDQGLR